MSREAHVRFWESAEVKSLRATQLPIPPQRSWPNVSPWDIHPPPRRRKNHEV